MIYSTTVALLQPYTLLLLVMALALGRLWRKHRELRLSLLWLAVPFLLLVIYSTGAVGHLASGYYEWQHPFLSSRPEQAQAIVVLGSGVTPANDTVPVPQLSGTGLRRCLRAAELYHAGQKCPVLVSGGVVDPTLGAPAESAMMRDLLLRLSVPDSDIVEESLSTDTWENARRCAELLDERQLSTIVLVTDATHLPRAVDCFERHGLTVIPAASAYHTAGFQARLPDFLPTLDGAHTSHAAFHELLGNVWITLRSWFQPS